MLGIKQSQNNDNLYILTGQATLCERQLKFTGHCIRMVMSTDEPDNIFVISESKIKSSLRPDAPRTTYLNQMSSYILPGDKTLEANEIRKITVKWIHIFVVSKKKKPPD